MTVFNKNNVDFRKNKMFFGEELNTQRFDEFKFKIFDKLTQKQLGFFWNKRSFFTKDRADYQSLTDAQKHIFTSNLRYQTLIQFKVGRKRKVYGIFYLSWNPDSNLVLSLGTSWDFS